MTSVIDTSPENITLSGRFYFRSVSVVCVALLVACGADEDPQGSGGSGSGGSSDPVCLDADFEPTDDCAVEPIGEFCEAAPNPSCAPLVRLEVSDPEADGPCVLLVVENDCDEVLYSNTCIEYLDDGEPDWQCWVSTTSPGRDVDVSQCMATGNWTHWSGFSSGQLDTVEGACNPQRADD